MIVLDASAAVELLLSTPRAETVASHLASEREAHAPDLIEPEVLAALRRLRRAGAVPESVAARAVGELGELALVRHAHAPLRERVWGLRDVCSSYDACYVALAERLEATLLTADVKLGRAATPLVSVRTVA